MKRFNQWLKRTRFRFRVGFCHFRYFLAVFLVKCRYCLAMGFIHLEFKIAIIKYKVRIHRINAHQCKLNRKMVLKLHDQRSGPPVLNPVNKLENDSR